MNASLVITLIGPDRTGLVDELSATIADHGANWLDSRLSHLAGQFAGMIHVHVEEEKREALASALAGIAGLSITVAASDQAQSDGGVRTVTIQVVGQDRPGILRQVAQVLAEAGANVEELRSEVVSAPMSGEALFQAEVRLSVPEKTPLEDLYHRLEDLADDIMVSLNHDVR